MEEALQREIQEEVWLTVVVQHMVDAREVIQDDLHFVGISFLVSCEDWQNVVLSNEHTGYRWKTKEEILSWDFPAWLKKECSKL